MANHHQNAVNQPEGNNQAPQAPQAAVPNNVILQAAEAGELLNRNDCLPTFVAGFVTETSMDKAEEHLKVKEQYEAAQKSDSPLRDRP